jgi:hypothetical protein
MMRRSTRHRAALSESAIEQPHQADILLLHVGFPYTLSPASSGAFFEAFIPRNSNHIR